MKTWSYHRGLIAQSVDGTGGRRNYPDGFVCADKRRGTLSKNEV